MGTTKIIPIIVLMIIIVVGGISYLSYIQFGRSFLNHKQKDYNIVFIAFDGLQARHLHKYGYPLDTTPNLDAFLGQSTLFLNAVSPAPWTVPSFMSILTSMYPSEHKVVNKFVEYDKASNKIVGANLRELALSAMTLAQVLKDRGYQTAGFTGDAGVSANFGFDAGFDTYYQTKNPFGGFDDTMPEALK